MNRNNHARNQRPQTGKGPRSQHHSNSFADDLKEIKAPYNFVPLSAWVHTPPWARQVSHDVPFRDGISGTIEYTLTAHTPLLVGNEQERESGQVGHVRPFRTPEGYAIPGTSLKGMIRSVMEIATFARMNQVDDKALSFRDLQHGAYTKCMNQPKGAGWLRSTENGWQITPCNYAFITHEQLAELSGNDWWKAAKRCEPSRKYELWKGDLDIRFTPKRAAGGQQRWEAADVGHGDTRGCLVFTGQPQDRNAGQKNKKRREFVFWERAGATPISVPDEVMRKFIAIQEKPRPGAKDIPPWEWWKRQTNDNKGNNARAYGNGIPVFYMESNGQIKSLGLAFMYRLPYEKTIGDAIPQEHRKTVGPGGNELADFTTTLFGCASPEDGQSLKGRVSFSLATTPYKGAPNPEPVVLSSPRPSYYPNYIQQTPANDDPGRLKAPAYNILMNSTAKIRGWKRYPARRKLTQSTEGTDNMTSTLHLLPQGTCFHGRIRIHNLKPEELGALVWVLSWGGKSDLRHSLGMGKSLGYGQVSITIDSAHLTANNNTEVDLNEARERFVAYMDAAYREAFGNGSWKESPQIHALCEMANPDNTLPLGNMILNNKKGINQFLMAKKNCYVLRPATPHSEGELVNAPSTGTAEPKGGPTRASMTTSSTTEDWPVLPVRYEPGSRRFTITHDKAQAFVDGTDAERILQGLTEPQRNRLTKGKLKAAAKVEKLGNQLRILELIPQDPQ